MLANFRDYTSVLYMLSVNILYRTINSNLNTEIKNLDKMIKGEKYG
jgi:hypothetical protein